MPIRWCSYYKPPKFFLYNQQQHQHMMRADFIQFSHCVWEDQHICHMQVNHDVVMNSRLFWLVVLLWSIHCTGCLMSGRTPSLAFEVQYLSQCLVLSWYLIFVQWMHDFYFCVQLSYLSDFLISSRMMNFLMPVQLSICSHLFYFSSNQFFPLSLSFVVPHLLPLALFTYGYCPITSHFIHFFFPGR